MSEKELIRMKDFSIIQALAGYPDHCAAAYLKCHATFNISQTAIFKIVTTERRG